MKEKLCKKDKIFLLKNEKVLSFLAIRLFDAKFRQYLQIISDIVDEDEETKIDFFYFWL